MEASTQPKIAEWQLQNEYTDLPSLLFTYTRPEPVKNPHLVVFNEALAQQLGLNLEELTIDKWAALLSGNEIVANSTPIAQAYAGHQYGHFAKLGDGRAILLGEHITPDEKRWDIQLKGGGRTPYSRSGDGRAALGPMLREYLISEAMAALGIATTRSLAVVTSGEIVIRETPLPGAILTRVASSHLRVGTFEFARSWGDIDVIKALADYAIQRHYPACKNVAEPYAAFLGAVIQQQAMLIARWQGVGFIHGVMNTDNMTISGETIDYGPCAFMDTYHPATVYSFIDRQGRYAYHNQPDIGLWNLTRFAEALLPLLDPNADLAIEKATLCLQTYRSQFQRAWHDIMSAKLGLSAAPSPLVDELFHLMEVHRLDMTNTFQALTQLAIRTFRSASCGEMSNYWQSNLLPLRDGGWLEEWQASYLEDSGPQSERNDRMRQNNPVVIPRNHLVEEALTAATIQDDLTLFHAVLHRIQQPFVFTSEDKQDPRYLAPPDPDKVLHHTYCGT